MDGDVISLAHAVGDALRQARDAVGWTRAELVDRMPADIHPQTLATYERGVRQCTVGRFVEICSTLGVSAPELLHWAMQHAEFDLPTIGVRVDLDAILRSRAPELLPLRRWARGRLTDDPDSGIAHLQWPVVREMARLFDMPRPELVSYLIMFTPRPAPSWPGPGGRGRNLKSETPGVQDATT